MRWRRVFSECLLVAAVMSLGIPSSGEAAYVKPSFDKENCEEVLPCHKCSEEEKSNVRECATTGKIQTLNCPLDPEREDEAFNTLTKYMTCNRTQDDEQSRFVHFQLMCLVLGTVSYIWVRRFRVVYASLFEQRKLSLFPRRPSDGDIELGNGSGSVAMATREEVSPLTNNSNLEVI